MDYLNADNFKKWMKTQKDFNSSLNESLVGMNVESKISRKKIANAICVEDGDLQKISKQFAENGGVIKEVDGDEFLIEVKSGNFYINKKYITY